MRTRVDGSLSITVEIDPRHAAQAFALFGQPGTPVAVARLTNEAANSAAKPKQPGGYGHHYSNLYTRGWFFNPRVIEAFCVDIRLAPEDRIEAVKEAIYRDRNVESLANISPCEFVAMCDRLGIQNTLPAELIDAAAGAGQ